MEGSDGYKYLCRCPFCDFLVRPAWLQKAHRMNSDAGTLKVQCPQCMDWYEEGAANQVEPLEAFLSSAHKKLGFPNMTVDKLRRIALFVAYEHHLINCDGERDESFRLYYEQVQTVGLRELLSEMERRAHQRHDWSRA